MQLNDPVSALLQRKHGEVWTISPRASVYEAMAMMSDKNIGALLVMEDGRLSGIIAERDYARKIALKGKSSRDTEVREIMRTPVTVTPNHTVDQCMALMTGERVRHLPVTEEGAVIGVISIGDLVNWIISSHEDTIKHLHSYIAGSYPA
ncbi:MAG: CBS domain-containing protein [Bryobacteraceae bacterium]|jgi:CBS domain-containing protein